MENEIKDIFRKICEAFAVSDIDSALGYFVDHEDMVKISNGKVLRGKNELSEYWYQMISSSNKLRISIDNIQVNKIDEKHVWTVAEEFISYEENNYKAIVSNILVLTDSGWKILLDHTTPIMKE